MLGSHAFDYLCAYLVNVILRLMQIILQCVLVLCSIFIYYREYTQKSLDEIELFINQKRGDFKSLLINFVQLQMHMHKKVFNILTMTLPHDLCMLGCLACSIVNFYGQPVYF